MKFKKSEKEFLKAIVKYNDSVFSIAEALNESKLLEKKGIAIIPWQSRNEVIIFFDGNKYDIESRIPVGYVSELVSLVQLLVKERYIIQVPINDSTPAMIGRKNSKWNAPDILYINGGQETVFYHISSFCWKKGNGDSLYYIPVLGFEYNLPIKETLFQYYTISQELRNYVKDGFKTEEDKRFKTQTILTWISIGVAIVIGLADKIISLIKQFY